MLGKLPVEAQTQERGYNWDNEPGPGSLPAVQN